MLWNITNDRLALSVTSSVAISLRKVAATTVGGCLSGLRPESQPPTDIQTTRQLIPVIMYHRVNLS